MQQKLGYGAAKTSSSDIVQMA